MSNVRVYHQLHLFLIKNVFLSPYQSGVRSSHSIVTALVKVTDDVILSMDNTYITVKALLDFSNAFNSIDFGILLAVLKSINISSDAIEWFDGYLCGRSSMLEVINTFQLIVHLLLKSHKMVFFLLPFFSIY